MVVPGGCAGSWFVVVNSNSSDVRRCIMNAQNDPDELKAKSREMAVHHTASVTPKSDRTAAQCKPEEAGVRLFATIFGVCAQTHQDLKHSQH